MICCMDLVFYSLIQLSETSFDDAELTISWILSLFFMIVAFVILILNIYVVYKVVDDNAQEAIDTRNKA